MHAHEVGLPQRLLKRYVLDPGLLFHQPSCLPQIVNLLNRLYEPLILIGWVVAQNIHVEPDALLDERQPDPPGPDYRHRLARDFVSQEWQKGMPVSPLVLACEMLRTPHFPRQRSHHEK